ncbi:hypothetical protein LTR56_005390 [Elasticomyces elasticus]|nr:hypothetical protein LTR22_020622 [Elasticomyces elasticus]KAK3651882.1 hypothetical protein LTR56_005390 [Elasticomyces elasticus]KAK4927777.1 hypothetical protein LTR49_005402 [Elasticomyces elasticus]KAK5761448.1 hypothetical protein LTS12_008410 [Elasticomyces elasticus]
MIFHTFFKRILAAQMQPEMIPQSTPSSYIFERPPPQYSTNTFFKHNFWSSDPPPQAYGSPYGYPSSMQYKQQMTAAWPAHAATSSALAFCRSNADRGDHYVQAQHQHASSDQSAQQAQRGRHH